MAWSHWCFILPKQPFRNFCFEFIFFFRLKDPENGTSSGSSCHEKRSAKNCYSYSGFLDFKKKHAGICQTNRSSGKKHHDLWNATQILMSENLAIRKISGGFKMFFLMFTCTWKYDPPIWLAHLFFKWLGTKPPTIDILAFVEFPDILSQISYLFCGGILTGPSRKTNPRKKLSPKIFPIKKCFVPRSPCPGSSKVTTQECGWWGRLFFLSFVLEPFKADVVFGDRSKYISAKSVQ